MKLLKEPVLKGKEKAAIAWPPFVNASRLAGRNQQQGWADLCGYIQETETGLYIFKEVVRPMH